MNFLVYVFAAVLSAPVAYAQGIFEGRASQTLSLSQTMPLLRAGDIVIIGENHGFKTHRNQQIEIMKEIRSRGLKVSVGMEFFYVPDQGAVDAWRSGALAETDFLAAIGWKSPSFDYYRDQALFPLSSEGATTLALNAPRTLTSKVAKGGLEALTSDELSQLPPQFQLGRDSYKERFLAMMPHLPSPVAGERYFAAQSIWDDMMAFRANEYMKAASDQVLVIVVGDFHVQYGGGLPDRIRARGFQGAIWTWSQVNSDGLNPDELKEVMESSEKYGPRADYLWVDIAQP